METGYGSETRSGPTVTFPCSPTVFGSTPLLSTATVTPRP